MPGFDPRPEVVEFMVEKVELGQIMEQIKQIKVKCLRREGV
jgi:hypothetical protein